MWSNVYRLLVSRERAPIAQNPLTITYNYKLSVRLTKMRFLTARVRLFRLQKFQKSIQRVAILQLSAWLFSAFWDIFVRDLSVTIYCC